MNDDELLRYSRHIMLPQIDVAGQESINRSRVLVLGAGGLGSPVLLYLVAAGAGHITVVDDDCVDASNLQRQILFCEADAGENKARAAAKHLQALNTKNEITPITKRFPESELEEYLRDIDLAIDCTDNLDSRLLLNRICKRLKKPLVTGAAIRFEGQLSVFDFRKQSSPCYSCLMGTMGEVSLNCAENGVFGPLVGVVGSAQALEALKILAGLDSGLNGKLALFDALSGQWRYLDIPPSEICVKDH